MSEHLAESVALTIEDAKENGLSLVAVNVKLLEATLEKLNEHATLQNQLGVAMSENQRLTKIVEDYKEEVFYEDKEGRGVRYKDWCQQLQNDNALLEAELAKYKGEWEKEEYRCPQCGLGNPRVALLEAKLAAIECAGCGKTMLECACDDTENG